MILCLLLAACNAQESTGSAAAGDEQVVTEKKISRRDVSITPDNAYNDLFLDSTAVEAFIDEHKIPDSISRRIRSFYNARNYQFAWFSSKGLTEQARGFWNLHDYHTSYNHDTVLHDKALQKRMDRLTAEEELAVNASDKAFINTEITLTEHFIQYNLNAYENGYVKRKEMERFVPRKQEDAMQLADSILNKKHKDNKYFEDINPSYKALKQELARYYDVAKNGGWPTIDTVIKKGLKQGLVSPQIAVIKKRLQLSGDLPASDTSQVFNDTLVQGVKSFQQRHGYTPDGIISANLIKDMNVPALQRVQQILINMDRMRWMPSRPSGDLILVNIPEFVLHVMDGAKKVFDMNVVVGKEGHNTVSFTGDLNQVVFSPYWNVPESIVEKEILPALAKNPNYLADNNMEQTGTENGFPVIRQLPGPENSLGKVKFLFPNSFNIYFHDTNAKDLFNKDKRAYSHGCIRLAEPEKMARYLLRNDGSWTPERIEEAMNSGKEKYVKLKDPVPVFISYHTAWVDEEGRLNFRDDIYNHDKELGKKMFTAAL
jgi:murein L,D-transpeptidase YcbB/YkuD